ncbi:MAG: hypothetical protein WEB53_17140 [Akkermansiaceae bacterium]
MKSLFMLFLLLFSGLLHSQSLTIMPGDQVVPVTGYAVRLEFHTDGDKYYQIESSEDLSRWSNEGFAFRGIGGQMSALVSNHNLPKLFYRVRNNAAVAEIAPVNPYGPNAVIGVPGPPGPVGGIGPKGDQGEDGPPGITDGTPTLSAAALANALGYTPAPSSENGRRPQFYDDFSLWSNGSIITTGTQPLIGRPYHFTGGTAENLTITNGGARPTGETLYYMGTELDGPVESVGMELSYIDGPVPTGREADLTLLIGTYDFWQGRPIIHIRLRRNQVAVEVGTSNGFTGIFQKFASTPKRTSSIRSVSTVGIQGDMLVIVHDGQRHIVRDSRIAEYNGKYLFFETGTGPLYDAYPVLHRIWANAPAIGGSSGFGVQPYSDALDRIARGTPVFPGQVVIGGNSNNGYNDSLVVNGQVRAAGSLIGMWGAQNNYPAPLWPGAASLLVSAVTTPVSSLPGPTQSQLRAEALSPGYLSAHGSSMRYKFIGSLADNVNPKRIGLNVAGGEVWSSAPLPTGAGIWDLEVFWFANSGASHNLHIKFTCGGTVSQGWHSRSYANTVNMEIKASGTNAGDITLQGGTIHLDALVR